VINIGVYVCGAVCSGDGVHVSHSGNDTTQCGPAARPCATLRYTLKLHSEVSQVYIDGTGGAYTTEARTEYLLIDRNLTLSSDGLQHVVIQCTDNQNTKLFNFSSPSHQHRITVSIQVFVSLFLF